MEPMRGKVGTLSPSLHNPKNRQVEILGGHYVGVQVRWHAGRYHVIIGVQKASASGYEMFREESRRSLSLTFQRQTSGSRQAISHCYKCGVGSCRTCLSVDESKAKLSNQTTSHPRQWVKRLAVCDDQRCVNSVIP
jgi:hypothetical protein